MAARLKKMSEFFGQFSDGSMRSYEQFVAACAAAPSGLLTGVWMSEHTLPSMDFPRLYPVVVMDTGTEVSVRSLPGPQRQLTMGLSDTGDNELSGWAAIHRPWPGGGDGSRADLHEDIRFQLPERRTRQINWLGGEWRHADLSSPSRRARWHSRADGDPKRAWRMQRLSASLDRAVLDEYADLPSTSEQAGPVMPRAVALSCLQFPEAGDLWHAAATQAARVLGPSWGQIERDEYAPERLTCLALIFYTLAYERAEWPVETPLRAVQDTVRQAVEHLPDSIERGPAGLLNRIADAVWFTPLRRGDTVWQGLYDRYTTLTVEDWHVGTDRLGDPPGPSLMARQLPWLSSELSGQSDTSWAPAQVDPLTIEVSGQIRTPASIGMVRTASTIACPECESTGLLRIFVDRTEVAVMCAEQHRSVSKALCAAAVWIALREARRLGQVSQESDSASGHHVAIEGDFTVRHRAAYECKLPAR
jgi:hypothetical protein